MFDEFHCLPAYHTDPLLKCTVSMVADRAGRRNTFTFSNSPDWTHEKLTELQNINCLHPKPDWPPSFATLHSGGTTQETATAAAVTPNSRPLLGSLSNVTGAQESLKPHRVPCFAKVGARQFHPSRLCWGNLDCTSFPEAHRGAIQEQQVCPGRRSWARGQCATEHYSFIPGEFQTNIKQTSDFGLLILSII
jgi:hypothetical protein